MKLLIIVTSVILLSEYGYAQTCVSSIFPPDVKSGCCGNAVGDHNKSGSVATIDEYPWMGLVEYHTKKQEKPKLLCGAVLISGKYVLSGAICFSRTALTAQGVTPVNIRLGEYETNNEGPDCVETDNGRKCNDGAISIPIEKFTKHPDYNKKNGNNDIVLIRLAKIAPYTDFIRPICLPSSDISIKAPKNLYLIVAGWGAINSTVKRSNVLRRIHVPYVDFNLCRHKYNTTSIVLSNGQICAGSKNRDSCSGDSGGPLMYTRSSATELVGIVSFGPKRCGQDIPGVYTKVFAYKDWIKSTMEADELISTTSSTPATTMETKIETTTKTSAVLQDFNSDVIVFRD